MSPCRIGTPVVNTIPSGYIHYKAALFAILAGQVQVFLLTRTRMSSQLLHIKTTLGMDVLSCKTPDMVEKEIRIDLIAYNLIRILMSQAALQAGRLPDTLSFKHCAAMACMGTTWPSGQSG